MCLILDANLINNFRQQKENTQPLWNWLKAKKGKIVYADDPDFKSEWRQDRKNSDTNQLWSDLMSANRFKIISNTEMTESKCALKKKLKNKNYELCSNDKHIITAALAGKAKLLASLDKKLGKDFKEIIEDSRIYKGKKHYRLLEKYECP